MKKISLIIVLLAFAALGILYAKRKYFDPGQRLNLAKEEVKLIIKNAQLTDGDIVFQTSLSKQSRAIQLATHSRRYSHCGLIYKIDSNYFVYEAVQPVKLTPLVNWIAKGKDGAFVVKRLKNAG